MAVITTTQRNAFNSCTTTLKTSLTSGTQTTGIVLNALQRNGITVSWPATSGGILRFYRGGYEEHIGFGSATVDSTTKEITLVDVTRALAWNDGSSFTTAGDGIAWPAGTKADLVLEARHMKNAAFLDLNNSFSGTQTFTTEAIFDKGLRLSPFADATARDAYFVSPANGDKCYVTGVGEQVYSGGAWVTINASSNSFGSTTVAGTYEAATAAERAAGTSVGGTGALLIPTNDALVKTSSGAGDENKIPVLNASGIVANGFVATSGTANSSTFLRGDRTWATPSITTTYTSKCVFSSCTTSSLLSNPTSETNFDTYTYQIPANDLVDGVIYRFHLYGTLNWGAGTYTFGVRLGASGSDVANVAVTPTASGSFFMSGMIGGTAAAGASVAVKGVVFLTTQTGANLKASTNVNGSPPSYATNGALDIYFSAVYSSSSGSNSTSIYMGDIVRESSANPA